MVHGSRDPAESNFGSAFMTRLYLIVPALIILAVVGLVIGLRLQTSKEGYPPERPPGTQQSTTTPDEQIEAIRDDLRKDAEYKDFLGTVQQLLNGSLDALTGGKPRSLTFGEQSMLKNEFGLDEGELAEVGQASFTPLDAHHLDLCFLLRDAVRSLRVDKLKPLDQASTGFAWVIRQVRLVERPGNLLPPHFVLRRGWGTADERALIFLAVLRQMGIDGCMLLLPSSPGKAGSRYWVPGALVDNQVYLFDTRLGLPLPGPKGEAVATLAQVRTQPELLKRLTVDARFPYDVTPEQARTAEIHVAVALAELTPRMQALQNVLAANEGIHLAVDPAALLQRFQAAAKVPELAGTPVRVWNLPGDVNTPIRVLRRFVPEDEGGLDKTQQREFLRQQVIPWQLFPEQLNQLPGEARNRLRKVFALPFLSFDQEARLSEQVLQLWLPGLLDPPPDKQGGRRVAEVTVHDRMPRDLELRGRFDEATNLLVAIEGELSRQQKVARGNPNLAKAVQNWADHVAAALDVVNQAQQATRNPKRAGADTLDVDTARKQLEMAWRESGPVIALLLAAVAQPMASEVTYLLALCKHEQAERAQARWAGKVPAEVESRIRDAWKSAESWWAGYLDRYSAGLSVASARRYRARALLALGRRDEAVGLLENLSADMPALEKTGHLYLAKQEKAR
jgi:hypothetical protein